MTFEYFKQSVMNAYEIMTTQEFIPNKFKHLKDLPTIQIHMGFPGYLGNHSLETNTLHFWFHSELSLKDICFITIHELIHHFQWLNNKEAYKASYLLLRTEDEYTTSKYEIEANYFAFIIADEIVKIIDHQHNSYQLVKYLPTYFESLN